MLGRASAEMQLFNLYVNSARALLNSGAFGRSFLEHGPRPHIVLAGFGNTGNDIARQAIESSFALPGVRLTVTVFDEKARAAEELFKLRNAGLNSLADFTFNDCTFALDDAAVWQTIEKQFAQLRADMVVSSRCPTTSSPCTPPCNSAPAWTGWASWPPRCLRGCASSTSSASSCAGWRAIRCCPTGSCRSAT